MNETFVVEKLNKLKPEINEKKIIKQPLINYKIIIITTLKTTVEFNSH